MQEKIKRLRGLQEQKSRKAQLESLRAELTKQQGELREKTDFLKAAMVKEQKDVERLEKGGVVSLFHKLTGRSEEKLQKEQREARDAKGAYEAAVWELESVEQQVQRNAAALAELEACEAEYEGLLNELMQEIKDSDDGEIEGLIGKLAEVKDETSRTEDALQQIEAVRSHLQEALRWVSTVQVENNEAARERDKALLNARWGLNSLQKQVQLLKTEIKIYPTMISGIGSETLTGKAIVQIIKNTFGHLSQAEKSLREHLEQLNIMYRRLEKERDDILIAILCGN